MRAAKRTIIGGALSLMALVAACGGSSGQKVALDATPVALRHAAEATLGKGTAKIEFTISMTIQGRDITMKGTGATDPANKRYQMSFDVKDLFSQVGSGQSIPPELSSAFEQPLTVVLDGTVMYMHFPALAKLGGGDKEWIKIDIAKANADVANVLGQGGGGALGSDPTSFLQFLEGAGKVSKVGEEDVRGVHTTHFSGSYTLKDALAQLPADRRESVEKSFTGLGIPATAEDQEIPFDAWVDDGGLIRRISTSFDIAKFAPANSPAGLGSMSMTMDLFDFGSAVDVQIPSDDEVQDLSALTGGGTSSKFDSAASSIN